MKARSYQIITDMLTEDRVGLYAQGRQGWVICPLKTGADKMLTAFSVEIGRKKGGEERWIS